MDEADPQDIVNMKTWMASQDIDVHHGLDMGAMTDAEVLSAMDTHFPGGAAAYVPNEGAAAPYYGRSAGGGDDGHVSMVPHGQWAT